jgi:hypothetical protein
VGIRDVGVAEYFYSRPSEDGSSTLDDFITELERPLDVEVRALRDGSVGLEVDPERAAKLVGHLVTRTAHIRSLIGQFMSTLVTEAEERFSDPESVRTLIGLDSTEPPERVLQAIQEALDGVPLEAIGVPRPLAERAMLFVTREVGDLLIAQNASLMGTALRVALGSVETRIRDAHNQALSQPQDEDAWTSRLSVYRWQLEAAVDAVLSDSVALAVETSGDLVPFLVADHDAVQAVVLPLSSSRVLVGRKDGASVDLATYNREAAACSDDFFISAKAAEDEALSALIGSRGRKAIEVVIDESFAEFAGTQPTAGGPLPEGETVTVPSSATEAGLSFKVAWDFDNEELARELTAVLEAVVKELARTLPLNELDGFTLAADYPNALRNLDRGSASLPPDETTPLTYGTGMAKAVTVYRNEQPRSHIVLDAALAVGCLSDDIPTREMSLHSIVKMLAHVAHGELFERDIHPGGVPDDVCRMTYEAVSHAPPGYFSSTESAFVSPESGELYASLVVDSLEAGRARVERARARYFEDKLLDPLMMEGLAAVHQVLGHAADWLGHRDGLPEGSPFAGSDLPARLRPYGLEAWLNLFGRDLRAAYGSPDGKLHSAQLFALSRHVERLLWTFQLFPWPLPEGGVYCNVGYGLAEPEAEPVN